MTVSLFVTEEVSASIVGLGLGAEFDAEQVKRPTIEVNDREGGYVWLYFQSPQHLRELAEKMRGLADKCDTILKGQQ